MNAKLRLLTLGVVLTLPTDLASAQVGTRNYRISVAVQAYVELQAIVRTCGNANERAGLDSLSTRWNNVLTRLSATDQNTIEASLYEPDWELRCVKTGRHSRKAIVSKGEKILTDLEREALSLTDR